MAWHIDRDYINTGEYAKCNRVGTTGNESVGFWHTPATPLPQTQTTVRFRCLDDDGEVYYGGWLHDDEDCENQLSVGAWAMKDAGATEVQVKRNGTWITEVDV